jgi:hypothetical protein
MSIERGFSLNPTPRFRISEAAHLGRSTSRRGIGQKYPDNEAGPLCTIHHREHHRGTKTFWTRHAWIDRDKLIDAIQAAYKAWKGEV